MHPEFNKLLKGCRNYDRKAQRQMMDLLLPFLLSICKRYETPCWSAQDLVQESLILIFNNINDARPEERIFMGWCKKVTINTCLGRFRKKQLEQTDLSENLHSFQPEVFDQLGVEAVVSALRGLPEQQRLVFNLHVVDGYSHAEIATMLQLKESHARTLLTRARTALQDIFRTQAFSAS